MHTSGAQGGAHARVAHHDATVGLGAPTTINVCTALPNLGRDMLTLLTKLKQPV